MKHLILVVVLVSLADLTFGQLEYYYPKSKCNSIIKHSYFTLNYSEEFEQPEWVIYRITGENIKSGISKRKNNFRPDPDVKTGSSESFDYLNSGYDRGHLLPAGDMKFSDLAMSETFYYSNITPQHPSFNRGIWLRLEELVRQWALKYDSMYIVTSGVLVDIHETIGRNKVGVPKYFYKIILHKTSDSQYESISFLIPNKEGERDLFDYTVTIDSLEKITGIDFFFKLNEETQSKFESVVNIQNWKTDNFINFKGNSPLIDVQNNLSNQKNLVFNTEIVKSNQYALKAYSENPDNIVEKINRCNISVFTFLDSTTKKAIEKYKPFKKIEDIAPILKDTIKYNNIIKILQHQL